MSDICHPPADWSCRFTEDELGEQDPVMIEVAEVFGWSLLASLTNYRIATCAITVRPCVQRCMPRPTYRTAIAHGGLSGAAGSYGPFMSGGQWYNACACPPEGCSCERLSEVLLPGPVGKIEEVWLNGELIPATAYRVYNGNRLVRTDGEEWPVCQDYTLDNKQGFSVRYWRGAIPNAMTKRAAGILANEFLLSCEGDAACRLPNNVIAASRSGEAYEFAQKDFSEGVTGIIEVDAVVRIFNPNKLKAPVIVASPDVYLTAV